MVRLIAHVSVLSMAVVAPVCATEGARGTHLNGTEMTFSGVMPEPGFYMLAYGSHERLTTLRDNSGNRVPLPFVVTVDVVAPVALWVTESHVLGGKLAFVASLPLLRVDAEVAGIVDRRSGLGDIVLGTTIGYHGSEKVHYTFGMNVMAPTGAYTSGKLLNLGRNYWNITSTFALSYAQRRGVNADIRINYDVNLKNPATDYRSGQELHMDYALGYGVGQGWVVGVGGYVYQQVTDDQYRGMAISNARGRAAAIGPLVTYYNEKNFMLAIKYQKEFGVRNRIEGHALKFKLSIPI